MTLTTLTKIRESLQKRPVELAELRSGGAKAVGYFCCYIPEEILYALDLIPIRLGRGGDERLVELGARYVSTKNCAYIREVVGLFAEQKDPFIKNSDLIASSAPCMQIYRLSELIDHFFKTPALVLPVPRTFYLPEGKTYFRKEVENFTAQLEKFSGKKLTETKLADAISLYKSIRETQLEIYNYQSFTDAPITWRQVLEVIDAGFYLDRVQYLSLLLDLLEELKEKIHEPSPDLKKGPRVVLSGTIIPVGDTKLIDIIEKYGGRIVADDLCTGLRPVLNPTIQQPTTNAIADAYLNRVPCGSLPYLDLSTDKRISNLKQLVKEYNAKGVIYHTLRYCDPFTFKANETKEVLEKEHIPFLEIHTEYARSDLGGIETRVEAFIEMIS
jgi:benzoyl-CoA reductase/2-hydroxyglutaryl-CoA dehydratase subunit BcrC/BadD/HgdB